MSLKDEIQAYEKAEVSLDTGEIEFWDHVIFPQVIRKRQIRLILDMLESRRDLGKILDFGCGAGWLSKVLSSKGYNVTGIDASGSLITNAMKVCAKGNFIVGDCINLPLRDGAFDCIVGSAILHHLEPYQALTECHRVTGSNAVLLLMEPNKLNPIAALGRKLIRIQTKDENPFFPWLLRKALVRTGWIVCRFQYLFPYSLSLSYLFRSLGLGNSQAWSKICPPIEVSERILEKVPYLNRLCYEIYVVAKKGDRVGSRQVKI